MYSIGHFSDFHLVDTGEEFFRALALVDHAIEHNEVDHLVITGDIVHSSRMDVYEAFISTLAGWGWASSDKLTVVPGNHDIFSNKARLMTGAGPQRRFERLCDSTKRTRRGRDTRLLVANAEPPPGMHPFPFSKVLSAAVVLVGMDTSVSDAGFVSQRQAQGELDEVDMGVAAEFLAEHARACHRIIAMHHCPIWADYESGDWIEMNFVDPEPEEVQRWIGETGANLVLCGHTHEIGDYVIGRGCQVLVSGASGGRNQPDPETRSYHLVRLPRAGRARYKPCVMGTDELDERSEAVFG